MIKYTVSIFILTYNQEQFIAQTIESILMQKTNFTCQLVIGEDCSLDATREICQSYASQFPDKIKLLSALEKNIGLIANYMRTIKECDGKYIAICDGDDYWIDEYKLQKQVDFLESNPDFSIVYTNYRRLYPDGTYNDAVLINNKRETAFLDLIEHNFIPSLTALFRNMNAKDIPEWIKNHPYGDWPTYLWTIKDQGEIHLIDEITAVYRMDIGVSYGIIKKNSKLLQTNLKILKDMATDAVFIKRAETITKAINRLEVQLMTSYNSEGYYFKAFMKFYANFRCSTNKYKLVKLYFYSFYKSLRQ